MEIKSKFLCSKGVALAFAMLLGGSPGVLLYANDSVEESLMVVQTGRTIKGLVTDANGEPLIGCNVVVVGSNAGVITDIDGRFTLNIPADAKQIKVSYIGYVDQIINLHDRSDFKVVLKEDNNALDEVVVVGYGTQKKATLTGAVEQIGSQVLESRAITNVGAALQGATPGLVVTRSSSRPGNEGLNFQIRGLTSVNGGSPLIIVDGVPVLNSESFQNLNSDDIENISVLKDGSASIYGAKAANGVILVTTKKGKSGTNKISYTGEFTMRMKPSYSNFNIMNSQEQMDVYKNMEQNGSLSFVDSYRASQSGVYGKMYHLINQYSATGGVFGLANTPEARGAYLKQAEFRNTDWFDLLFSNSISQNHAVSMATGTDKASYYTSISVMNDPGWTKQSKVQRYTANLNALYNISKKVSLNLIGNASYRKQRAPGSLSSNLDPVSGEVKRVLPSKS